MEKLNGVSAFFDGEFGLFSCELDVLGLHVVGKASIENPLG